MNIFGTYKDVIKNSRRANVAFSGVMISGVGAISMVDTPALIAIMASLPLFVVAMNVYKQQNDSYNIARKLCHADSRNSQYWMNAVDKCPVEMLSDIDRTLRSAKKLFIELNDQYSFNNELIESAINACFGYVLVSHRGANRCDYLNIYPEALGLVYKYEPFRVEEFEYFKTSEHKTLALKLLLDYSSHTADCRWIEYMHFTHGNSDMKALELLLDSGCSETFLRSQLKNFDNSLILGDSPIPLNF